MAETWVSRAELEEVLGKDGADMLCRTSGGVPLYVPRSADASTFLGRLLGPLRLAALTTIYGGMRITVPNGRRAEPFKGRIIDLLQCGTSAEKIAMAVGVTERYVRMVARHCKAPQMRQLSLLSPDWNARN